VSGALTVAKFLMCVQKKLQSPMKDLTAFMSVGGCAALIALSLSLHGLIPSGVKTNPR